MRTPGLGDIAVLARGLLALPEADWAAAGEQWCLEVHAADRMRKRLGRRHPDWGDGSLAGRFAPGRLPPEPPLPEPRYLAALRAALGALEAARRRRQGGDFTRRPLLLAPRRPIC